MNEDTTPQSDTKKRILSLDVNETAEAQDTATEQLPTSESSGTENKTGTETQEHNAKPQEEKVETREIHFEDLSVIDRMQMMQLKDLQEYVDYLHAAIIVLCKHTRLDKGPANLHTYITQVRPKMEAMRRTGIIQL